MKILYYIPSIDKSSGGIAGFIQPLARGLGKLCELHIATHKTDNMVTLENCELHFLPSSQMSLKYFQIKREFLRLLDQIHPDVVHSNGCWTPYSAYTITWAEKLGYQTVLSPHGMLEPYILKRHYLTRKWPALMLYQKRAIKKAFLVATSELELNNLSKLHWNSQIAIVPNCVQIDEISPKTNYSINKSILYLGRIHEKKGIELLVEAVCNLKEQLLGWAVSVVGNGDEAYIQQLKESVKQARVDDIIKFHDPVYGQEKFDLYRKSDLFILPTYSENFGIVVAEALACGVPVITTKGTPWSELESGHCGWWCDTNADSITNALQEFLRLPSTTIAEMGNNGRQLVEKRYSVDAVSSQMMELYMRLKGVGVSSEFGSRE